MKLVLMLLGLILIAIAVMYFVLPADQLPAFFPGHAAGETRIHMKHGLVAGAIGVALLTAGWIMGRRG
jgi:hypothetical protein